MTRVSGKLTVAGGSRSWSRGLSHRGRERNAQDKSDDGKNSDQNLGNRHFCLFLSLVSKELKFEKEKNRGLVKFGSLSATSLGMRKKSHAEREKERLGFRAPREEANQTKEKEIANVIGISKR